MWAQTLDTSVHERGQSECEDLTQQLDTVTAAKEATSVEVCAMEELLDKSLHERCTMNTPCIRTKTCTRIHTHRYICHRINTQFSVPALSLSVFVSLSMRKHEMMDATPKLQLSAYSKPIRAEISTDEETD